MKRILFLGAGFLQKFVIQKAKEMGHYVLALDPNSKAEGLEFCDEYELIDITDQQTCYKYAAEKNIDAVITVATDYGVLSAAYIGEKLNLPSISYETATLIKNKFRVRELLSKLSIDDTGKSYEISDVEKLSSIYPTLDFPVMVKPTDGSGSRGTTKVNAENDLREACLSAIKNSINKTALIEPFIDGQEYGVESFVQNDKIWILAILKKNMTDHPFYAELGHSVPSGLSLNMESEINNIVTRAIRALGINYGSVNMDILITNKGGIHIIDIGARMGGNMIGSHIIPIGKGIDYMSELIRASYGEVVSFKKKCEPRFVVSKILALSPMTVYHIPDICEIEKKYDVSIYHKIKKGSSINKYENNVDGMGYIVSSAEEQKIASQNANLSFEFLKEQLNKEN